MFWDIGLCSPLNAWLLHADFLLDLLFCAKNGGDVFLRIVGSLSLDYTALYPRKQNSSEPPL
jgi:hypothetical protein